MLSRSCAHGKPLLECANGWRPGNNASTTRARLRARRTARPWLVVLRPRRAGQAASRSAWRSACYAERGADGEPCGIAGAASLLGRRSTQPGFRHRVVRRSNNEGTRQRTEIVIEQIRGLSEQLALTPQYGGAQIVIIDPADAINHAACNALVEDAGGAGAGALPVAAQRRSRRACRRRSAAAARSSNSACRGMTRRSPGWPAGPCRGAAADALAAARGHPGLADAWLRDGGLPCAGKSTATWQSYRAARVPSRKSRNAGWATKMPTCACAIAADQHWMGRRLDRSIANTQAGDMVRSLPTAPAPCYAPRCAPTGDRGVAAGLARRCGRRRRERA